MDTGPLPVDVAGRPHISKRKKEVSELLMVKERFYQKYSDKMHENVCMSPVNECMLWTGCKKGNIVKYGVINC